MNHYLNALKTFTVTCILTAGVMLNFDALAWCSGDGTPDCSATINNQIDQNSPYYQGGSYGGSRGISAPVYVPTKPSKFGAVAFDPKTSTYGYSSAQKSARLAKSVALTDCGLSGCKITSSYANQCAALAWGNNGKSGWLYFHPNLNLDVAKEEALAECQSKGGSCQIVMAECSLP